MAAFGSRKVSATLPGILNVDNNGLGIDSTLRDIQDTNGNVAAMQISTTGVKFTGTINFGSGGISFGGTFSTTGNFSTGGTFSTASTFSTTGTFSSGGNFSTGSTFSTTGAFSTGGAFSTAGTFTTGGNFTTSAGVNFGGSFTTTGGALILTLSADTNVTLPTSGTLITASNTVSFSNKHIDTVDGNTFFIGSTGLTALTGSGNTVVMSQHPTISGFTDGSNASAGNLGEYLTSSVASGVSLTSATSTNITSLSVTAGDWDIEGSATTVPSAVLGTRGVGLSLTSATMPDASTDFKFNLVQISPNSNSGQTEYYQTGRVRLSISITTTVYLVCNVTIGSGTCTAGGVIRARRVR